MSQPYQSSPYAHELEHILAALNVPQDNQEKMLPEEEPLPTIHVYPVEGGGVLFSPVPLEQDEQDEDDSDPLIIDGQPPDAQRPVIRPRPPRLLTFVLLLGLFLLLDAADSQLIALLTPTVTITLTPEVRRLSLQGTAALGKLLSPITLTQSQTVPTTGHGHQDARAATGTLTFYNGLAMAQVVAAGTRFTAQHGGGVATDADVTIPPANPPRLGEASVAAHALQTGAAGNLPAEEIDATLAAGLYVKNLASFGGGQDVRDFPVVTSADRDSTIASVRAKVTVSMTAALQGQLTPGEALSPLSCSPAITTDHAVGDEASHLTVTVSETCSALAYNAEQLDARAMQLLTARATTTFGAGYELAGNVQVRVTRATPARSASILTFTFVCQGTYIYSLSAQAQQRLLTLVAGQPRLVALRVLLHQRGIRTASITGLADNQPLPDDQGHLHLLIVAAVF